MMEVVCPHQDQGNDGNRKQKSQVQRFFIPAIFPGQLQAKQKPAKGECGNAKVFDMDEKFHLAQGVAGQFKSVS
ncbi:hypothetical protein D3C87_1759510 [compost metagenome]